MLREKVIVCYEQIFNGTFDDWDSFFLLTPNEEFLAKIISQNDEDTLLTQMRSRIRGIFKHAILAMKSEKFVARINGMRTINILLDTLCAKKFHEFHFIMEFIADINAIDDLLRKMVGSTLMLLNEDNEHVVAITLEFMLRMFLVKDNVNQNMLIQNFLLKSMYVTLTELMKHTKFALPVSHVFAILLNYRRHESANPVLSRLSSLNDDKMFESTCQLISRTCKLSSESARKYFYEPNLTADPFNYVASVFAGVFSPISADESIYPHIGKSAQFVLFYELLRANGNFKQYVSCKRVDVLQEYIIFCSYMFQRTKTLNQAAFAKLLLTCSRLLVDSGKVCGAMCDERNKCTLRLNNGNNLLRKKSLVEDKRIACYYIDTLILFLEHNLKKKLQSDMYKLTLESIQLLLQYLHKNQIRLQYQWTRLYTALMGVASFMANHEEDLSSRPYVKDVMDDVIIIFNMIITHGDSFLPDTISYDDCYYTIIQSSNVWEKLRDICTNDEILSPTGSKRKANDLSNMLAICSHYMPLLSAESKGSTLTPESVYNIIRNNYDTIELKIIKPPQIPFYNDKNDLMFWKILMRLIGSNMPKTSTTWWDFPNTNY